MRSIAIYDLTLRKSPVSLHNENTVNILNYNLINIFIIIPYDFIRGFNFKSFPKCRPLAQILKCDSGKANLKVLV